MIKQRDVLERNLELLLKRGYAPAIARQSFRAQVERDYFDSFARKRGGVP